jgi:hypothetical protein
MITMVTTQDEQDPQIPYRENPIFTPPSFHNTENPMLLNHIPQRKNCSQENRLWRSYIHVLAPHMNELILN